jgi:GDP-L-fucose synthase
MYKSSRVLVTGGSGLIGSHTVEHLLEEGANVRTVVRTRKNHFASDTETLTGDLRSPEFCAKAVEGMDYVFHCAGQSGGLGRVGNDPIPMFTDNMVMSSQVLDASRNADVSRFAFASTASVYPDEPYPVGEDRADMESIGPVENHAGLAKRISELQCQLYFDQTDMKIAIVRGGGAYGPRDNYDLENSHVIPALIRKSVESKDRFEIWGTGETVRDFTHASDVARGLIFALEHHAECDPLNIATGRAATIMEVARIIMDAAGRADEEVHTLPDRPSGTPIKLMAVDKMHSLGFETKMSLEDGFKQSVDWYASHM